MFTTVIDSSLSNSAMYEHIWPKNIKKLYKYAGKWAYQQKYKDNIEVVIVSTPERFTENIPMQPGLSVTVKNNSERKSLRIFTEVLDVKKKTAVY